MKKLIFVFAVAILFSACQNGTKKTADKGAEEVFTVDEIKEKGDHFVGKTVVISGTVSHVCKHSGQRCFLMGSNEDITIRVEAGKEIGSFTQNQMGSDLKISGVLHEVRIDETDVAEMEANAETEHDGDGNHGVNGCSHDRDQVKHMADLREKIESSDKGYISFFYVEGEKYETLN